MLHTTSKGGRDVTVLSGTPGLLFDSSFLTPLLFFFVFLVHLLLMPCPFFFANDPFSRLFSQKILKHFSFRVSCFLCVCFVLLFLSNRGWQLVEGFDLKTMIK